MNPETKKEDLTLTDKILNGIERVGNKLPQPIILFFILAGFVLFISWFISLFNVAVQHPGTGETIKAVNLLSKSGLQRVFTQAVNNFTQFAPLGVVLVAMLGVGIADKSGLITAALKKLVMGAPDRYITAVVVFAGIMSNLALDAGYVVLVPLGAIIFAAKDRHPLVGLAAAFAGVSGGFSANLIISALDPLLAGLSTEAAQLIDPSYTVVPSANWWFMIASTFLVTIIGTWVTEKIVAPRFGEYHGEHSEEMEEITPKEQTGMKSALIWTIITIIGIALVAHLLLRGENGDLIRTITPFVNDMVPLMPYFAIIISFAKKYDKDLGIGTIISTMLPYSVAFFIGWAILLVIWCMFNIPIGPGGTLFY